VDDAAASALERQLLDFAQDVLRWNERFSLISRVEPKILLPQLIDECRAAFVALFGAGSLLGCAGRPDSLLYLDLGTGGGFPGLIWHLLFCEAARQDHRETLCFEPRDKRAWFLEQCTGRLEAERFSVFAESWGRKMPSAQDHDVDLDGLDQVVISMKALRLTDAEVLGAWRRFAGEGLRPDITIARFVGEGYVLDPAAAKDLELPKSIHTPSGATAQVIFFSTAVSRFGLLLSNYPAQTDN
jgi:hypothetical protein